ncbi:hypothetical protein [Shewanella sp. KCT]|uniref:hypothetical protein n=1 Tax=Shewanella sp. KCT TaxID=2569535 RepID=UPI001182A3ED|nr:hypothetical protein [Shewanella sp. KCT]TVP11762.1 hypothetical protein AYI87_15135 [Shewanella sp. KCT]
MSKNKCNCFDDILKRYQEKVKQSIDPRATELEVSWDGYCYIINGGDYSPVNPKINVSYRGVKTNGEPCKAKTKDQARIIADYCPFCGRKLAKDGEAT